MAAKRVIARSQAERLVSEFQVDLLRQAGYTSTWELYTEEGASHCCGGIFRLKDAELRQIYHELIDNIDGMEREQLLQAILNYEQALTENGLVTCQGVAAEGRVCDGLNRYTNSELSWWFPEALRGFTIVDDLEPTEALTPSQRRFLPILLVFALVGLALFVLTAFLWQ